MKRVFFVLMTLIVLVGCAPATPTLTVGELLGSVDSTDMDVLKIVDFQGDRVVVELNGERVVMTRDSEFVKNIAYVVRYIKEWSGPGFQENDLFDESDWEIEKKHDSALEFYVVRDYRSLYPVDNPLFNYMDESALTLVLIPVEEMPKVVDPKVWVGSEVSLWVWEAPTRYPWVIQNTATREIAFFHGSIESDINGVKDYVVPGMQVEGVVTEGIDSNGKPVLIISDR